jgi:DNA-directed RNA polymerase specialized sigma24 family protein
MRATMFHETFKKGLASLSATYRQVLILRDIEHLNIAETSKLIGISEAAVKTRPQRARFILRDALAPVLTELGGKGGNTSKSDPGGENEEQR